eukprot:gnl/MRDRNA2_/MRDRNA2_87261_c0_seq1.p2 gnl/MRDRNA2_/MRDRNA2_87261_c0~~gnl/MRDRNA2_/MRDRNA2_87261_c0_seq1.p2  ORF type:complete len:142 (+),score=39.69 gnl/MRDRNA2_/MRDRNA2_87261_c0_seq1:81-506(+)
MSCATVATFILFMMAPQMCAASLLAKKHHHHQKGTDPAKVDQIIKAHEQEEQEAQPDPNDPNDFGLMDKATLDAEFPTTDQQKAPSFGMYDLRQGHVAILDTPQKMDPEWQAQQHLQAVNAMSHVKNGVLGSDADDNEDDD